MFLVEIFHRTYIVALSNPPFLASTRHHFVVCKLCSKLGSFSYITNSFTFNDPSNCVQHNPRTIELPSQPNPTPFTKRSAASPRLSPVVISLLRRRPPPLQPPFSPRTSSSTRTPCASSGCPSACPAPGSGWSWGPCSPAGSTSETLSRDLNGWTALAPPSLPTSARGNRSGFRRSVLGVSNFHPENWLGGDRPRLLPPPLGD